jgi:LPXTG-motif cell wall-anchored protein
MRRLISSSVCAVVAALALVATASAQSVSITAPANGATVPGPDVTVSISVTGTTLVAAANATRREDLHVHYMLDTDPAPYLSGTTPVPQGNPNIVHTAALSNTFTGVAPGAHRVVVLLGYSDHTAFQPPVAPAVSFNVGAAGAGAAQVPAALPRTGDGLDVLPLLLAACGALGLALGTALRRRRNT